MYILCIQCVKYKYVKIQINLTKMHSRHRLKQSSRLTFIFTNVLLNIVFQVLEQFI